MPTEIEVPIHLSTGEDDRSVATEVRANEIIIPNTNVNEYTIEFNFAPRSDKANNFVARCHYDLLHLMKRTFADIELFDNNGNSINFRKQMKTFKEHATRFKLHYLRGNEKKQRSNIFLIFHRIQTALSVNEIRQHHDIQQFLMNNNIKINDHEWDETETRISNLGFLVKIDPSNYLRSEFENVLRGKIATATKLPITKIPKFKCRYSSPFLYLNDNRRLSTKAYNLEVPQDNAKAMIKMLKTTFAKDPYFVFHRMRHEARDTYADAIRTQNDFLSNTRVVPIVGVTPEIMFYLSNTLTQLSGIQMILKHKLTNTKGRYSVITTTDNFNDVPNILKQHLHQWVKYIKSINSLRTPDNFPSPTVAFCNRFDDNSDSDGTMQSYLSACSSLFTVKNESYDNPPMSTILPTQAWASSTIPTSIIKTATTTPSSITEAELQKKDEMIEKLLDKVDVLSEQVTQLLKAQKQSRATEYVASTIPQLPTIPINDIRTIAPPPNFALPDHQIALIINSVVQQLKPKPNTNVDPLDLSFEISTIQGNNMSVASDLVENKDTTL